MYTALQLSRALSEIAEAAADLYSSTNHPAALFAAASLRAKAADTIRDGVRAVCSPHRSLNQALSGQESGRMRDLLLLHAALTPWTVGEFEMPDCFAGRFAFVELLGPNGVALREDLRFGLYLQEPDTYYPPHSHAAEEYYFVLSGKAAWQIDDGDFFEAAAGSFMYHASWQRHAMETAEQPLLAMWVWTGNLDTDHYQVDGGQSCLRPTA